MNEIYIESPIGAIELLINDNRLLKARFSNKKVVNQINPADYDDKTNQIIEEFSEYFKGTISKFDCQVNLNSGTNFQQKVWRAMLNIPYGRTVTYQQIAEKIGMPKAARAVGMACNKNPINVIVPCHRVVGSTGSLTGYAGGIKRKEWLLAHEAANSN